MGEGKHNLQTCINTDDVPIQQPLFEKKHTLYTEPKLTGVQSDHQTAEEEGLKWRKSETYCSSTGNALLALLMDLNITTSFKVESS